MERDESDHDAVGKLLIECENTLRTLHQQKRLTADALQAFVDLSARVREEIERRRQAERRAAPRPSPDRRATGGTRPRGRP
jgi:hypothetical protein